MEVLCFQEMEVICLQSSNISIDLLFPSEEKREAITYDQGERTPEAWKISLALAGVACGFHQQPWKIEFTGKNRDTSVLKKEVIGVS